MAGLSLGGALLLFLSAAVLNMYVFPIWTAVSNQAILDEQTKGVASLAAIESALAQGESGVNATNDLLQAALERANATNDLLLAALDQAENANNETGVLLAQLRDNLQQFLYESHLNIGENLFRFLRDDMGSAEMAVDGSVNNVTFFYEVPPGVRAEIGRALFYLRDAGGFDSGGWGNNGGNPLANGIALRTMSANGTLLFDILDGQFIDSVISLTAWCYDLRRDNFGSGHEAAVARWTFAKSGRPIILYPGERLEVVIRDDLTYLVSQTINIQGVHYPHVE